MPTVSICRVCGKSSSIKIIIYKECEEKGYWFDSSGIVHSPEEKETE